MTTMRLTPPPCPRASRRAQFEDKLAQSSMLPSSVVGCASGPLSFEMGSSIAHRVKNALCTTRCLRCVSNPLKALLAPNWLQRKIRFGPQEVERQNADGYARGTRQAFINRSLGFHHADVERISGLRFQEMRHKPNAHQGVRRGTGHTPPQGRAGATDERHQSTGAALHQGLRADGMHGPSCAADKRWTACQDTQWVQQRLRDEAGCATSKDQCLRRGRLATLRHNALHHIDAAHLDCHCRDSPRQCTCHTSEEWRAWHPRASPGCSLGDDGSHRSCRACTEEPSRSRNAVQVAVRTGSAQ